MAEACPLSGGTQYFERFDCRYSLFSHFASGPEESMVAFAFLAPRNPIYEALHIDRLLC